MVADENFEQGMRVLETLLNREITATQNVRDEAIQKDYKEVLAGKINLTPEQLAAFTLEDSEKRLKKLDRLLYWMKKLNPKADEALLIAAYSHDIERILRKKDKTKIKEFDKGEILVQHQVHGGEIMFDF